MATELKGQVTGSAAEVYEEVFVPAIFQEWANTLAGIVGLQNGDKVLDVACGTGAFARTVAHRVAPDGTVEGLDCNEGMLAVARAKGPKITWREGRAEALPYDDGSFDVVVSQFGLMFFDDPRQALSEMWRVLRPGGRLAVSVWDRLENSPGYAKLADLIERLYGTAAADEIRAPFRMGQPTELRDLAEDAGIFNPEVRPVDGNVRYDSLDTWMKVEIKGWTLADVIDDEQFALLKDEAPKALRNFTARDGAVRFAMPAQVIVGKKA